MGLSLHAGIGPSNPPGSTLLISILTGAPAASVLAFGLKEPTKGTATPATPAVPTTAVAPIRKLRRPGLTSSSLKIYLPSQAETNLGKTRIKLCSPIYKPADSTTTHGLIVVQTQLNCSFSGEITDAGQQQITRSQMDNLPEHNGSPAGKSKGLRGLLSKIFATTILCQIFYRLEN